MRAVLNGPQGQTVLESSVLTIGSSPYNSLVLDNIKVSAHHAEIRPEEQGYAITDLGSIHGTYVNGERLDFNALRRLNPGNSITIGDSTFTYRWKTCHRTSTIRRMEQKRSPLMAWLSPVCHRKISN